MGRRTEGKRGQERERGKGMGGNGKREERGSRGK